MKKGIWLGVLLVIAVVIILTILFFPKTGFSIQPIDKASLENLRLKAEVECLKNSQCSNTSECINNACVNKEKIDICREVSLSTTVKSLQTGDAINSAKKTLSGSDLPDLLTDGKLFEIIEDKLFEYPYSPSLLIGTSKIDRKDSDYLIRNNEPIYTYRLFFPKGIDFSNKNLKGQILRILGNEYIIGSNSDNSNIYLVSDKRNILLQEKDNIKMLKDDKENIIQIEIVFFSLDNIKVSSDFTESTFDAIKLSFNNADNNFADVRIGEKC